MATMRIRSLKPEFWANPEIAAMDYEIVHEGPLPRRVNAVAPMAPDAEYVYMLFDADASPVYVGRSFRPADRIGAHRRKPWWEQITSAVIVRIQDTPSHERRSWRDPGANTARFEAIAIAALTPSANIATPTGRVRI